MSVFKTFGENIVSLIKRQLSRLFDGGGGGDSLIETAGLSGLVCLFFAQT